MASGSARPPEGRPALVQRPRQRSALPVAVLTAACALAFARTVGHGFLIWDDRALIATKSADRPPLGREPRRALDHAPVRPVRAAHVHAVGAPLGRLRTAAVGVPVTNVGLHVLGACAVYPL